MKTGLFFIVTILALAIVPNVYGQLKPGCPCVDSKPGLKVQNYPQVHDCATWKAAGLCTIPAAKPTCPVTCGKCQAIWPTKC